MFRTLGIRVCKKTGTLMPILFFFFLFSTNVFSKTQLSENIVTEYLKLQKEFSHESCRLNTEDEYRALDKNYRGDGRYIPVLLDGKLDSHVLKNSMSLINQKSLWIQNQIEYLKTTDNFSILIKLLDKIDDELDEYYKEKNQKHVDQIFSILEQFKEQAPFLLSFKFPLNHLELRSEYERYKNGNSKESRLKANSIFFHRNIVQDGSFDDELVKNDSSIRAAFDTVFISIQDKQKNKLELSDNDRVDLLFIIRNYTLLLKEGKKKQMSRLDEWKKRTDRSITFYQDLISPTNGNHESILTARANALFTLKDFVLKHEAETYKFWTKQSDLMQAIYVIETILYNEVGRMDAPDALERKDVAQVILNRFFNEKYNTLLTSDAITKYIAPEIETKKNKWLNILFKEGEFSFTYFYIPGNFHIYCPDMSRTGNFYRKENARIALDFLNHPRTSFKALRYFSRVSMFGRISMDTLWTDFISLPEVPGTLIKNSKKIKGAIDAGRARLLYKFSNSDNKKTFNVVEIKNKKYVIPLDNIKNIYNYRSPHHFRYFAPIK